MDKQKLVWSVDEIAALRFPFRHPLDETADVTIFPLTHAAGMTGTSVSLGHLEPGCTSFAKHRHHHEDEWIYIISGEATLEMDDSTYRLSKGSFAAFPAGGPAHKLTNTGDDRLEYLMGGNQKEIDVVDFPDAGRRMIRTGSGPATTAETAPADAFAPFDFMARMRE